MSVTITIQNAVKRYGNVTVIPDLSVTIRNGELFTLLGPSGCGKTTLLRMIAGFNTIEGGSFKFNNRLINDMEPGKRGIGMVFQNYAIFPNMTVRKNVEFGLKYKDMPKEQMRKQAQKFLELVHVDQYADRMPERLSGGQQQRVALARALVIQPDVLLMDEPLSNLDAKLRVEMRTVIKNIQKEVGITTVYVTHDQEEAMACLLYTSTLQNWYRDQLFPECVEKEKLTGENAFSLMMEGLDKIEPGCGGLITLPYFAGERTPINDPSARGMIFGLNLGHTKQHLYRSALEGIGFSVSQHIDIFRENGLNPARILAAGGGTKNRLWMQMIADITGIPVAIAKETSGASYGDALMAAVGAGHYRDFESLKEVIRIETLLEPDLAITALYRKIRPLFDRLYRENRESMHAL